MPTSSTIDKDDAYEKKEKNRDENFQIFRNYQKINILQVNLVLMKK